jgi:uncharacterized protein (DUF302 family)
MKRLIFSLAVIMVLGTVPAWAQTAQKQAVKPVKPGAAMLLENESKFGFKETVEMLKLEVEKKSWKISGTHDLQQSLKASGTEVLPVTVLAICHPKHSSKVLTLDDERIVSTLMPCRISVYQKSNGKTYIARLNSASVAESFDGVMSQVMLDAGADIEAIIAPMIVVK